METYIWIVWCIGAVKSTVLKQLENAESERNSLGTIFEDFPLHSEQKRFIPEVKLLFVSLPTFDGPDLEKNHARVPNVLRHPKWFASSLPDMKC